MSDEKDWMWDVDRRVAVRRDDVRRLRVDSFRPGYSYHGDRPADFVIATLYDGAQVTLAQGLQEDEAQDWIDRFLASLGRVPQAAS